MMQRLKWLCVVACGWSTVAQAQDGEGCMIGLTPVPTVEDRQAPVVATGAQGRITVNPLLMAQAPPALQQFIYWHECGHVVLRHPQSTPAYERDADCFALRLMSATRQLSGPALVQLTRELQRIPGDANHLPGPARVRQLLECPAVATPSRAPP